MSDLTLLSSVVEHDEEGDGPVRFVRISVGGDNEAIAIVNAVQDHWHRLTGRPEFDVEEYLTARVGEKVTLIRGGANFFGANMLAAQEGTLFVGSSPWPSIRPKGARTKGYKINPAAVVDVLDGFSADQAKTLTDEARAKLPLLRAITQERIEQLPEESGDRSDLMLSLALFGSYQMPDSMATDAILLCGEYMKEDDIVDSCILLIRPEHGVSEHGSQYGKDLLRFRMGEIVGYEPITFAEGIRLTDLDFDEAFAAVMARCQVTA